MSNILVVDDYLGNIELLTEILSPPHTVYPATTEGEALQALSGCQIDLAIIDWGIRSPEGHPVGYWDRTIRAVAAAGVRRLVFNTATDDSSGQFGPLVAELRKKGLNIGFLAKDKLSEPDGFNTFIQSVRREIG
jgi:CheY-like chemotaxis protein